MTDDEIRTVTDGILDREGRTFTPGDPEAGDPPTKYGITSVTLGRFRQLGREATAAEVRALTEAEAGEIYRCWYIEGPHFDAITEQRLRLAVIDYGVNSGVERAAMALQKAAGVPVDGEVGPVTLAAVAAGDPLMLLCRVTRDRLRHLVRWIRARPAARARYVAVIDRAAGFLPE